jgi:ubiquinone/menaquinone biosynthesis C-methylase UbiE
MDSLADKYNEYHRTIHSDRADVEVSLSQWHVDAMSLAPPLETAKVLEIGCGGGDFSVYLSTRVRSLTAVDFSPAAIDLAMSKRSANDANVEFRVADAQDLPFDDNAFDVIFSCECLEHLPDPQKALHEMFRVLRPGGELILTTENYSNAMVIYWALAWVRREPFNSGDVVQPIENFFLFWRVKQMMRTAGLEVRRIIGAHHVFFAIPGFHPHLFVRKRFRSPFFARVFRPFARHVSFRAAKPAKEPA